MSVVNYLELKCEVEVYTYARMWVLATIERKELES